MKINNIKSQIILDKKTINNEIINFSNNYIYDTQKVAFKKRMIRMLKSVDLIEYLNGSLELLKPICCNSKSLNSINKDLKKKEKKENRIKCYEPPSIDKSKLQSYEFSTISKKSCRNIYTKSKYKSKTKNYYKGVNPFLIYTGMTN